MKRIYLDHNATTPLHPDVLKAMLPVFEAGFGNPSSIHSFGRNARVRIDEAREQVANLIHAHPGEIVFTSGGTESDNLAILGVALALKGRGRHIITGSIEHPAVLNPCKQLERLDFNIDYIPVDRRGRVQVEALREKISSETILLSIQHANSEVGTLQDIATLGAVACERGILFHTDAVQSAGKIPLNVGVLPVDLLSISAHKLNGPKGIGALYIKRGTPGLFPLIDGGGQEKKRRGGTENVPGIVGFGKAAQLASDSMAANSKKIAEMRDRLWNLIRQSISGVEFFGDPENGLPNTLSLGFENADGQALMIGLDMEGIAVSTGSACSSGSLLPSHVLSAMQIPREKISGALRITLGWSNTDAEVDTVCAALQKIVKRVRENAALPA